MGSDIMFSSYRLLNSATHQCRILFWLLFFRCAWSDCISLIHSPQVSAINFSHDNKLFFAIDFNRKGCCAARTNRRMTFLDGELNILWIVIAPIDDDQVFDAPGNKQLMIFKKAEVARAQKRASPISQLRLECARCLLWPPPVAPGDIWTRDPYLADNVLRADHLSLGINDKNGLIKPGVAAAHKGQRLFLFHQRRQYAVLLKRRSAECPRNR